MGLRRIRQEYQSRLFAWLALCRNTLPMEPEAPAPEPRRSALDTWLASPTGARFLREIRWALLPPAAAMSRFRTCGPTGRTSDAQLTSLLHARGVPHLVDHVPYWGADSPSWQEVLVGSANRCQCPLTMPMVQIPQSERLCSLQRQPPLTRPMSLEHGSTPNLQQRCCFCT